MRKGLLLGGLFMVSSSAIAMDYSHPYAPKTAEDCDYYSNVVNSALVNLYSDGYNDALPSEEFESALLEGNDTTYDDMSGEGQFIHMAIMDAFEYYKNADDYGLGMLSLAALKDCLLDIELEQSRNLLRE